MQKKKSYLGKEGVLNAGEVQEAQRGVVIRGEIRNLIVEQAGQPGASCAPRIYSICRSLIHNSRTCPER
jgi:hypothetical protein